MTDRYCQTCGEEITPLDEYETDDANGYTWHAKCYEDGGE